MTSEEIRKRFISFFEKRSHMAIPSASLVPTNDSSVLFNTAGMQPLVPFLMGEAHPAGKRLVNIQKCVRTQDIDEVGDKTHDTFFEMMGNWSLGDYFKQEAIEWSYELLTSKTEGFGLDPRRIYVTCFEGDDNAPKDEESANIWRNIFTKHGIEGERIYFLGAENNWWSPGDNGPCGPDTEMFYDLTGEKLLGMTKEEFLSLDDLQKVVEIWNDVFMEYLKKDGQITGKLATKNVDTGSGLERIVMALQGVDNIFATDLFKPLIDIVEQFTTIDNDKAKRIVVDHLRTAVFMIADGVTPTNTDRGYILRRLIRRAVNYANKLEIKDEIVMFEKLTQQVISKYKDYYPELISNELLIKAELKKEIERFKLTLTRGLKELSKLITQKNSLTGQEAFILFTTYGFPIELTMEILKEKGLTIDQETFNNEFKKHQELSRAGSGQKFKGGLAGGSEQELKYHTATHLLHQALRDVLGNTVTQKGSNITPERLRFDFSHPTKLTPEQIKQVEDLVNSKIKVDLPVNKIVLPKIEAEKLNALHFFGDKYGEMVSIYFIGDTLDSAYSKEFCGGPHVTNTGSLGQFKITKEEAIAQGIRRIKAILE